MKLSWSNNGNLVQVTLDATPGETHMLQATVTEHPVEQGAAITDNVRPGAFKVSLDCVISNTPVALPKAEDDSFTEGATLVSQQVSLKLGQQQQIQPAQGSSPSTVQTVSQRANITLKQASSQFDRVRRVYEALTNVMQAGTPVTIQSSLALYDSMIIVSMSVPRSAEMGSNAMRFTLECQQIRTVQSQTVAPPPAAPKKVGHKAVKEEKDLNTNQKNSSAWHNMKNPKAN